LGPLSTAITNRPIMPAPGDYDDGEIGGMMIGRRNRSTWRKLQSAATCSRLFVFAKFSTLKMEAIRSSETSVYTRCTRRHVPEDGILHSQRCENLKSFIIELSFVLF
jgi:hypothetical protein